MKLSHFFVLSLFVTGLVASTDDADEKCERLLKVVSDIEPQVIQNIYAFKKETQGHWRKEDSRLGVPYILAPKEMIRYEFSWTVAKHQRPSDLLKDGSLVCEFPASWQLILFAPVTIVFPTVIHGKNQDLPLHAVSTVAGIYLAKARFSFEPDDIRLLWHLFPNEIPTNLATDILARYEFIGGNIEVVERSILDKERDISLVALNLSNSNDISKGNQHWLISDANAHQSMFTRALKWLPWFKPERAEWTSKTPFEAYQSTVVAGPDNALVYDRNANRFLPEPILGKDRLQMVFDAVATSTYPFIDGSRPLFAHLVFRQTQDFKFITFEIARDGKFELRKQNSINDPAILGLPSAQELGFGVSTGR